MRARNVLTRLVVAALLSGAVAGASLFIVLSLIDIATTADPEARFSLIWFIMWAPVAGMIGALLAGLPALLIGSALWLVGPAYAEARHWITWIIAGLCVGGLVGSILPLHPLGDIFFIVALASGGVAALAFYWLMRVTEPVRSDAAEGA